LAERSNGDTKTIINRVEPLTEKVLGNKITLRGTLEDFSQKRCDLVHKGIGNVDNSDIDKIKYICEIAIAWIIQNKKVIRNVNILEQYYAFRNADKERIRSIRQAIKIVTTKI
jgi:hypothetical protein